LIHLFERGLEMQESTKAAAWLRRWTLVLGIAAGPVFAADNAAPVVERDLQRYAIRAELFKAFPHIPAAMRHSASSGFGGDSSRAIATHMYSRTDAAAIADARAMLKVEEHGKGTWLLRLPYVNIVVFETSEGLVLIDAGYAPAGPVLVETLRKLSNKPVHTIVFTHHHADHAFGAWALLEAGEKPQIIATDSFMYELGLDVKLANYANVRLNDQDPNDVPRRLQDLVLPTSTFGGSSKSLQIGGEEFVLNHARGETADQLWVHVPGRKVVVSADYHQPFLPNAGNGKRRQRYVLEWADALRAMAATQPDRVLPMHGPAMTTPAEVQDKLIAVARALEAVDTQVVDGLNAGKRQHEVAASVTLPQELAARPDMEEYYVRVQDIGKMVLREYSGWWDDVPSNWSPAPLALQGREIAALAGGTAKLLQRSRALFDSDPALACHLADWALQAEPDSAEALRTGIDAYANRIRPGVPAQEINVYVSHMSELTHRLRQLDTP
jgi:glyoxylase-like metal-dependent hydrolase (beta-lactamase superfamily II)